MAGLASAVGRELRQRGFTRDGRTYRRSGKVSVQIVNLQSSTWNSSGDASPAGAHVFVNLYVFYPALNLRQGGSVPERPKWLRFCERLDEPDRPDGGWFVTKESVEEVAARLVAEFDRLGEPWLRALDNVKSMSRDDVGLLVQRQPDEP